MDDDGVDALGDDVLGLRHLVVGVVLGRLHQHLVAGGLRRLLEERHIRVEIAERGLLLQHERDPAGLARHALIGRGALHADCQNRGSDTGHQSKMQLHFLPPSFMSIMLRQAIDGIVNNRKQRVNTQLDGCT